MPFRNNTSDVIDDFLIATGLATTVALIVLAPNALGAVEKPLLKLLEGRNKRSEARRISIYLRQQKLVEVSENADGTYSVRLSSKGRKRATRISFDRLEIPKEKWDQKWRIMMFDIPEKYKTTRDYISRHMRQIGFKQLQKSVFVFPYPCEDFIALLRELFPEASKHIVYLTAEEVDNHNKLVQQFSHIL